MTEEKRPAGEGGPASCELVGGCPICRVFWPSSWAGRVIVLAAVFAAAALAGWFHLGRSGVERLFDRYDALKRAGRGPEADEVLDEVIVRGIRLYQQKRFAEAKRLFERIIEREPQKPLVLNYLGLLEGALGDEEKAIRHFRKAVEIDPLSSQPYWNLALIYYGRKDFAACEEQLGPAMKYARFKSQYRLLYALCAVEQAGGRDVIVGRLRDTVLTAVNQARSVNPEDLAADGSLERVFAEAARRLAEYGDEFGYDQMKELASSSPKAHVRDFAARLLAQRQGR